MHVKIGPYKNWIGPYQIADCLEYVGVSKDRCHKIGEFLSEKTWVGPICTWIDKKKKRKVKIHIDKYDTWNMNSTLALIILPMLKQLKATKHGAPFVDDSDVPEHIRSTNAKPKENEWDTDGYHFDRWDWVLSEMIWTFEQLHPDSNWEDQYHSGVHDFKFVESEHEHIDLETGKPSKTYEMVKGPNDTHKFDIEGFDAHVKRMDAGVLLFGKYFRNLWD
jgi:hypothetical protein